MDGDRTEPAGRQQAPTWMGAIAVLTGGPLGVRMQARDRLPRRADRARRLPPPRLRPAGGAPARHAAGRAGDEPHHRHGAEPRAAGVARHDGRGPRARAEQPGRGGAARRRADGGGARRGRLDDRPLRASGIERDQAEQLVELHREAIDGRRAAHGPRRARRGRRRGRAASRASRSSACPSPGGSRSRWRRRGGPRLARPGRRAGRPGHRRGRAWVAATLTARGLAEELRSPRERMSASSAPSRPTPTWTAASSSRWTCTRASRRPSRCSATGSSTPRSRSSATTTTTCPS